MAASTEKQQDVNQRAAAWLQYAARHVKRAHPRLHPSVIPHPFFDHVPATETAAGQSPYKHCHKDGHPCQEQRQPTRQTEADLCAHLAFVSVVEELRIALFAGAEHPSLQVSCRTTAETEILVAVLANDVVATAGVEYRSLAVRTRLARVGDSLCRERVRLLGFDGTQGFVLGTGLTRVRVAMYAAKGIGADMARDFSHV